MEKLNNDLFLDMVNCPSGCKAEGDPLDDAMFVAMEMEYVYSLSEALVDCLEIGNEMVNGVAVSMQANFDAAKFGAAAEKIYLKQFGVEAPQKMRNVIEKVTSSIYQASRDRVTRVAMALQDKKSLEYLRSVDNFYVGKHLGGFNNYVVNAIDEAVQSGFGVKDMVRLMIEKMGDVVDGQFWKYAMVARTSANRIRNWSRILAFDAELVSEVEFVAMMDERTSEVCEAMNGAVFEVSKIVSKIQEVEAAGEDRLPEVSPFPKIEDILAEDGTRLSDRELEDAGIVVPPLHPYCRSVMVYFDPVVRRIEQDNQLVKDMDSVYESRKGLNYDDEKLRFPNPKGYADFSDAEKKSLLGYTQNGYEDINRLLRYGNVSESSAKIEELKETARAMMSALEKINPADTRLVTRRIDFRNVDDVRKELLRDVVFKSFTSTTTNTYNETKGIANNILTMHIAPKSAIPIREFSAYKQENELLFKPATALRFIKSIEENEAISGKTYKRITAYYEEY